MRFFRDHWFDLGACLAVVLSVYIFSDHAIMSRYKLLMSANLLALFLHQLEEYRIVGNFPGMINKVIFASAWPDRYPLNTLSALVVNVVVGWGFYGLAAVLAERAVWLGLAVIMISLGNIIVHVFVFNIRGRTIYNAGMFTAVFLFAPIVFYFFKIVYEAHLIGNFDYWVGIPFGLMLNFVGIFKIVDWMKNRNTTYVFSKRSVLPSDR